MQFNSTRQMILKWIRSAASIFLLSLMVSCGRNTGTATRESSVESAKPDLSDTSLITPEQPFKNQPNEFCTVVRKLDASYYARDKNIEDPSAYPKKYCLIDVCLEHVSMDDMTIDLGEDGESVTTVFKLIKVFDSYEEAKAYVEQYKIVDYKFEEE